MADNPNTNDHASDSDEEIHSPVTADLIPVFTPPPQAPPHSQESPRKLDGSERKHEPAKWTDHIMAWATVVMAIATICLGILAYLQWRDSGKLNDAATKAAIAADQFQKSAVDIKTYIGLVQGNLKTMADSSRQSVQITQDAMRVDQRAWVAGINIEMDAPEAGKKIHGFVLWSNSGKSLQTK